MAHRRLGTTIAAAGLVALGGALALVLIPALLSGGSSGHGVKSLVPGPPLPARPGPLRAGPPAPPAPATEQLGVDIGLLFNLRIYSQAQVDAQLSALARTGATLVRNDAPWEATEPAPPVGSVPHYRWSFEDRIVASLARFGLEWLPVIDYSPPWARSVPGVDHSAPTSALAYAAYAGALATRYGVGGTFWRAHPRLNAEPVQTYEIWNEPDSTFFWKPRPNPAVYARLYLRARVAIKSAQPGARVIIGGLTRPARFLPALLAAEPGLRGHIDGVGVHPYGGGPQSVLARIRRARVALQSSGLAGVPLYVTEFGWSTQPVGGFGFAPASRRPQLIYQTVTALRHTDCGVAAILLYAWFTPELNPRTAGDWFGITSPRAGPTPAVRAFTEALKPGATVASASRLCPAQ